MFGLVREKTLSYVRERLVEICKKYETQVRLAEATEQTLKSRVTKAENEAALLRKKLGASEARNRDLMESAKHLVLGLANENEDLVSKAQRETKAGVRVERKKASEGRENKKKVGRPAGSRNKPPGPSDLDTK